MRRRITGYNEKLTYYVEHIPNTHSRFVRSAPIETLADAKLVAKMYQTNNLVPKSRIKIIKKTEKTTVYENELKV